MSWDNLAVLVVDLFTPRIFKYNDSPQNHALYNDIYEPIFIRLRPFFRSKNIDWDKLIDSLQWCHNLLIENNSSVNPVYSFEIEKIISANEEVNNMKPLDSKKTKHSEKRRNDLLISFMHVFILDYNKLRKALGKPKMNYSERCYIDEIAFKNAGKYLFALLFIFVLFGATYIYCLIKSALLLFQ